MHLLSRRERGGGGAASGYVAEVGVHHSLEPFSACTKEEIASLEPFSEALRGTAGLETWTTEKVMWSLAKTYLILEPAEQSALAGRDPKELLVLDLR